MPSAAHYDPKHRAERQEPSGNAPDLSGVRVLIVEDDFDLQVFFTISLRQFGADVKGASSAREAMETIGRFKPDVLVSDIAMPEEDGYTLIRRVRLLPREEGGRVPAMAVTALTEAEDRARALWAGFQMYVRKPVDPEELAKRVAMLVDPNLESAAAA